MRKLIVFLLATLAILTACSQQSNNSSSSQGGAGKGDIVTKSYKTEKQLEHGKETRILTVSYRSMIRLSCMSARLFLTTSRKLCQSRMFQL